MKHVLRWRRQYLPWVFREVQCDHCGNQWWETVEPKRWATTHLVCACNEGADARVGLRRS